MIKELLKKYDEYEKGRNYKDFILKTIFISILMVIVAIYCGNVAFGKNSLDVMFSLQKEKKDLQESINRLKKENAKIQKAYFELKNLSPKD